MKKKILTVVGARPQFIKAAPVSRELRKRFNEVLVHTGQHYDIQMSRIFFRELGLPKPDYNLNVGSDTHAVQTGKMLMELEKVILKERPNMVLVYGDTNSTLSGALVTTKLNNIPLIHVEAGLRSYNWNMPEEVNRVLTDQMSEILLCPTETAVKNLKKEGARGGIHNVGDVMYDAVLHNTGLALEKSKILKKLKVEPKSYALCTIHRAENTDDRKRLTAIFRALADSGQIIILPLHPRTKKFLENYHLLSKKLEHNVKIIDPIGPLDMLALEKNAKLIITDSGGVQKEAYFMEVPCVTLRNETEWVETLKHRNNMLVGADYEKILKTLKSKRRFRGSRKQYFGNGDAAKKIVEIIVGSRYVK